MEVRTLILELLQPLLLMGLGIYMVVEAYNMHRKKPPKEK